MELNYHTKISFIKSILRIIGYVIILFNIPIAVIILVLSEILGILEEIKEIK